MSDLYGIEALPSIDRIDDRTITGRFRRYTELSQASIPDIRSIPSHWRVEKLKHISTVRFSNVDKHSVDGEIPVRLCNYVDVYYNDFITAPDEFMEATATPSEIQRFSLEKGDVLITKDSESWDDIAVSAYVKFDMSRVLCGYHLSHIRPRRKVTDGAFLARAFAADGVRDQFRMLASGITRYGLSKHGIENALFPIPPLPEQRAIANFLDRETAKIDALIAKKRRLIELLQEKRRATITRTITNGNASTIESSKKSSSESLCVKRLISFITSGSRDWSQYYSDDGDVFLQSGNIDRCMQLDLSSMRYVSPPPCTEGKRTHVERDDVLVCVTGQYTGAVAIVEREFGTAYVNQHVAILRPRRERIVPRFLAYSLFSDYGQVQLLGSQYGGTKQGLGLGDVMRTMVPLPSLDVQAALVEYMDAQSIICDRLVAKIKECIDRLKEYRSALISAAVTGKIDVRNQ